MMAAGALWLLRETISSKSPVLAIEKLEVEMLRREHKTGGSRQQPSEAEPPSGQCSAAISWHKEAGAGPRDDRSLQEKGMSSSKAGSRP